MELLDNIVRETSMIKIINYKNNNNNNIQICDNHSPLPGQFLSTYDINVLIMSIVKCYGLCSFAFCSLLL